MHKLRAALRQIATERGDSGEPELRGQMIDLFVDELEEFFTPAGLETFSPQGMREVYYAWMMAKHNPGQSFHLMSRFAPLGAIATSRKIETQPKAPNVVSLH